MSLSSLKSAIGVGIQSAKGALASTYHYMPVLNGNVMGEQLAQNLPPEVGGTYFSRGAYKAGLRSRGEVALIPRPNTIGFLLAGLFNDEETTAVGGGSTLYDHVFKVGDSAAHPNFWLTLRRYVNNVYGEQMQDARVGAFRLEVAAANIVNASVQLLGGQWAELPGADVASDDAPVFLTCNANVSEGGVDFIVDRFSIEIGAQLTDNEFRVGSYFLDDITLLQRQVTIQADVRVKNRTQFAKVYRNGASAPTIGNTGAWSPTIYRSDVVLQMNTGETDPEFLKLELPGVDFLTFPVQVAGAELIRAQLSCSVTLGEDNFSASDLDSDTLQPIIVTLRNERATNHTA